MNFISKEALQRIREEYTEGTRVELTRMSDPYRTDLPRLYNDGRLMLRQTVMLNASATVSEEEYRRRLGDLTDRFRAEEEKLKRLTAERKKRDAESVAIGGMLFELTELEAPPIEFDEKLWHAVVDHVTVYNDDRLVYSLKDGTEITIEL